jgi:hypothetical protein
MYKKEMAEKLYVSSDIKVPLIFKGKLWNFNKSKIHKSGEKDFLFR